MGNTSSTDTTPRRGRKPKNAKANTTKKRSVGKESVSIPKKDKITAYMATFPSREDVIGNAIKSLINQVDKLVIWANGDVKLPSECYHPKIEILYAKDILDTDIGCAGKFALAYEWDGYVFTVDDDIVYPSDYVEKSIAKIEEYQRKCVFSWHGRIQYLPAISYRGKGTNYKNCSFQANVEEDTDCNIIGTGCLFFHTDAINPKYDIMEMCWSNVSDILFAISMNMRQIRTIVPAHNKDWIKPQAVYEAISYHKDNDKFHIDLINLHNWG